MSNLSSAQIGALLKLGLTETQIPGFLTGECVVFQLVVQGGSGIAAATIAGERLRCGIIDINDPVEGLRSIWRFRDDARQVAIVLGFKKLELYGAAVLNPRLERVLLRQGFVRRNEPCPDELNGGDMEVLSRVFSVD